MEFPKEAESVCERIVERLMRFVRRWIITGVQQGHVGLKEFVLKNQCPTWTIICLVKNS
jgi:hypothetical protein